MLSKVINISICQACHFPCSLWISGLHYWATVDLLGVSSLCISSKGSANTFLTILMCLSTLDTSKGIRVNLLKKTRRNHSSACVVNKEYLKLNFTILLFWPQDHETVLDLSQNLFIGYNFKCRKREIKFKYLLDTVFPPFHLHEISVIHLWQ